MKKKELLNSLSGIFDVVKTSPVNNELSEKNIQEYKSEFKSLQNTPLENITPEIITRLSNLQTSVRNYIITASRDDLIIFEFDIARKIKEFRLAIRNYQTSI